MTQYRRCTACNGSKIVAPLGGIERKCKACKGVGQVEVNKVISDKDADKIINESIKHIKVDKRSKAYRDSIGR